MSEKGIFTIVAVLLLGAYSYYQKRKDLKEGNATTPSYSKVHKVAAFGFAFIGILLMLYDFFFRG